MGGHVDYSPKHNKLLRFRVKIHVTLEELQPADVLFCKNLVMLMPVAYHGHGDGTGCVLDWIIAQQREFWEQLLRWRSVSDYSMAFKDLTSM